MDNENGNDDREYLQQLLEVPSVESFCRICSDDEAYDDEGSDKEDDTENKSMTTKGYRYGKSIILFLIIVLLGLLWNSERNSKKIIF
jgi:hypothetical protein